MRKRNKIMALGMAFALCGMLPSEVHAADIGSQEGTLTLHATVPSSYELAIPITSMDIEYDAKTQQIGTLSVKGNIEAGKSVTVSVKEKKNFKTASNPGDTVGIPFKVTKGSLEFLEEEWSADEIKAVTPKEISLFLEFEEDAWTMAHSGDYTGSIVFLAEVK